MAGFVHLAENLPGFTEPPATLLFKCTAQIHIIELPLNMMGDPKQDEGTGEEQGRQTGRPEPVRS